MAGTDRARRRSAGEALDRIRFRYLRHVIRERWPLPWSAPTMLDISRDASPVVAGLTRLGLRVERIRLRNTSLKDLHRWLLGQTAVFDVVCCWDALQHASDWRRMLGAITRALRSAGVLCYGVSGRERKDRSLLGRLARAWMTGSDKLVSPADLHPVLSSNGLIPQSVLWLGYEVGPEASRWADQGGAAAYIGHAFRRSILPPSPTRQFWRFSTTQGQWVYGSDLAATFRP